MTAIVELSSPSLNFANHFPILALERQTFLRKIVWSLAYTRPDIWPDIWFEIWPDSVKKCLIGSFLSNENCYYECVMLLYYVIAFMTNSRFSGRTSNFVLLFVSHW